MKKNQLRAYLIAAAIATTTLVFNSCEDEPAASPEVTTTTLESASLGDTVSLTGTNLPTDTAQVHITVGGIAATINNITATRITFTVPRSLNVGNAEVVVTINDKVQLLEKNMLPIINKNFTVRELSKNTGKMGEDITINGTFLHTSDLEVYINGVKQNKKNQDSSSITIELVAKTFSGAVVVQGKSKSVTASKELEYEETYSIKEIALTGITKTIGNLDIINDKFYFGTSSGIFITGNDFVATDTLLKGEIVDDLLLRKNGDILISMQGNYMLRIKKDNTIDSVIQHPQICRSYLLENSSEVVYFASWQEGKIKRFSEYSETLEEIISITRITNIIFDNNQNIIVNSLSDNKLHLINVTDKTEKVYLDYSATIPDGLELSHIIHPTTKTMYLFSNSTDAFYKVNTDKTLSKITFDGITFDKAVDLVFDDKQNLYLVCYDKLYYLNIN